MTMPISFPACVHRSDNRVSYDTACLDCAIVKIDAIYEFIREARPLLDMAKTMMTGSKTERLKVMMRGGGK